MEPKQNIIETLFYLTTVSSHFLSADLTYPIQHRHAVNNPSDRSSACLQAERSDSQRLLSVNTASKNTGSINRSSLRRAEWHGHRLTAHWNDGERCTVCRHAKLFQSGDGKNCRIKWLPVHRIIKLTWISNSFLDVVKETREEEMTFRQWLNCALYDWEPWVHFSAKDKQFCLPYCSSRRYGMKTSYASETGGYFQRFRAAGTLRCLSSVEV